MRPRTGGRGAVAPIAVQRITSSLALVALGATGPAWLGAKGVIAPIAGLGEGPEGAPLVAIGTGALLAGALAAAVLDRVGLRVTVALALILLQREPHAATRGQPEGDRRRVGDGRRVAPSSTVDTPDVRRLADGAQDSASSSRITASDAA
jgi:hypothetical protein